MKNEYWSVGADPVDAIVSPCCHAPTKHTYCAPYGLSSAYLAGTERHTCTACGREYKAGDWAPGLPFFYD